MSLSPETPLDLDIAYTYFQSIRRNELHTAWSGLVAGAVAHRILFWSIPPRPGQFGATVRLTHDDRQFILATADTADTFLFASHLLHTEFRDVFALLTPEAGVAVADQAASFARPLLALRWLGAGDVGGGEGGNVSGDGSKVVGADTASSIECSRQPIVDGLGLPEWKGWAADALTSGFNQPSLLKSCSSGGSPVRPLSRGTPAMPAMPVPAAPATWFKSGRKHSQQPAREPPHVYSPRVPSSLGPLQPQAQPPRSALTPRMRVPTTTPTRPDLQSSPTPCGITPSENKPSKPKARGAQSTDSDTAYKGPARRKTVHFGVSDNSPADRVKRRRVSAS